MLLEIGWGRLRLKHSTQAAVPGPPEINDLVGVADCPALGTAEEVSNAGFGLQVADVDQVMDVGIHPRPKRCGKHAEIISGIRQQHDPRRRYA